MRSRRAARSGPTSSLTTSPTLLGSHDPGNILHERVEELDGPGQIVEAPDRAWTEHHHPFTKQPGPEAFRDDHEIRPLDRGGRQDARVPLVVVVLVGPGGSEPVVGDEDLSTPVDPRGRVLDLADRSRPAEQGERKLQQTERIARLRDLPDENACAPDQR